VFSDAWLRGWFDRPAPGALGSCSWSGDILIVTGPRRVGHRRENIANVLTWIMNDVHVLDERGSRLGEVRVGVIKLKSLARLLNELPIFAHQAVYLCAESALLGSELPGFAYHE
jgi:hypothetical protein